MHGGEGVPKCVIFDVRSIFGGPIFRWKFFPLFKYGHGGTRNFSRYNVRAWKSYDQPSLNLNNSTIWRDTLTIFSEFPHRNTFYEKLAWNLQHDAPFPGGVPVKTPHSARSHNAWKKKLSPNFLGACLKGVFSKVCGSISVKFSGFVEMDTLSRIADICSNSPTPLCAIRG